MDNLTAAQLKSELSYDPVTGVFSRENRKPHAPRNVGCISVYGYLVIRVAGVLYLAHRLAWLYVHGQWPAGEVDHIDGDKVNNRITNLRDVPDVVNQQNIRKPKKNNRSGYLGVWETPSGTFVASVHANGRTNHLGTFADKELAHAAYVDAKRRLHEGCSI